MSPLPLRTFAPSKKSQMKKPLISGGMAVLLFFLSAIALLLIVKYVIL